MNLSGSDSNSIRATSFSTLSKLAIHSSKFITVKAQIYRDIQMPADLLCN